MTVVASRDLALDQLYASTHRRTLLEKYRRQVRTSIGFGVDLADPAKAFNFSLWSQWPWQHDPEMEKLLQEDLTSVPIRGSRVPGVNDPCLCGSKKKFKKCCKGRIETAWRSQTDV